MTITIGNSLPKLTVDTNKGIISLADYASKPLVIYFYPKDNTPGCTTESIDFRDLYPEFQKNGVEIFGVSRDSIKLHIKFSNDFNLPFALISDQEETLCKAFDVIKLKKLYGKEYMGIERSTFLFNGNGKLAQEWRNVKVSNHAQNVLAAVDNI